MGNLDKFCGCLIGGAAGDALGYAIEFKREDEIFSEYGKEGITGYDLILEDDIAEISDDTQMTLFTAEGLLLAGRKDDSFDYINSIREMYMCWYQTQIEKNPHKNRNLQCRLLNVSELYNRRCPGMTCMSAIGKVQKEQLRILSTTVRVVEALCVLHLSVCIFAIRPYLMSSLI